MFSKRGYSPIHYAAYYGQISVIEYLVNNQSLNVNEQILKRLTGGGRTPLHLAVSGCTKRRNSNFAAIVSKLLELKANPDVKDNLGRTAKEYGENIIKYAIADYNSKNYDYFKDKFLNCDCASMKRDEYDYDVIDVDWESCFECEHGPCYFDWSSINPGGS